MNDVFYFALLLFFEESNLACLAGLNKKTFFKDVTDAWREAGGLVAHKTGTNYSSAVLHQKNSLASLTRKTKVYINHVRNNRLGISRKSAEVVFTTMFSNWKTEGECFPLFTLEKQNLLLNWLFDGKKTIGGKPKSKARISFTVTSFEIAIHPNDASQVLVLKYVPENSFFRNDIGLIVETHSPSKRTLVSGKVVENAFVPFERFALRKKDSEHTLFFY